MSMNPERERPDDQLVTLISTWLGGHASTEELRSGIEAIDIDDLSTTQLEAVRELQEELANADPGERGDLEMVARETLEAVALDH
jgi:hypothetical protein